MSPSQKKPTSVIEVRVDIRSLAIIATYYTGQDQKPQSKSGLIRTALEDLADVLVAQGLSNQIESTTAALERLAQLGLGLKWNRRGRNRKSLLDAIKAEELTKPPTRVGSEALNALRLIDSPEVEKEADKIDSTGDGTRQKQEEE